MQPVISYYKNGKKHKEECFLDDKYHRIDGAAYTEWHENGNKKIVLCTELFCKSDTRTNNDNSNQD
jgi:hypothetical protein